MHGAAQAFDRARVIGAAKSVVFKKTDRVIFKISFQKILKFKKITKDTFFTLCLGSMQKH